jgi:DNA-binding ferritin-like protein (Dps family)
MSNRRLPADYPSAQRQIADYLFQAGHGADLQILKVAAWDCHGRGNQK